MNDIAAKFAAWRAEARANPLFSRAIAGGGGVALLDQAAKALVVRGLHLPARGKIEISGLFDLTYVQNLGASFGLLAGSPAARLLLSGISIAVIALLVNWLAHLRRLLPAIGVALIVGGAVGNLIDRVALGYVVDFLDFSGFPFPHLTRGAAGGWRVINGGFVWVFNVADAAINIGIACLLVDWVRQEMQAKSGGQA